MRCFEAESKTLVPDMAGLIIRGWLQEVFVSFREGDDR